MAETAKKSIYMKLLEIQKENVIIKREWKLAHRWATYATLDDINTIYKPILSEHWILIFHQTEWLTLTTILFDCETEKDIKTQFTLTDTQDSQNMWKQLTYGKRYNLWQLLNIVTEEDLDEAKWDNKSKAIAPAKPVEKKEVKPTGEKPRYKLKNLIALEKAINSWDVEVTTRQELLDKIKVKFKVDEDMENEITALITNLMWR
jgi:hypothetical protein